jgi:hypothetical protein
MTRDDFIQRDLTGTEVKKASVPTPRCSSPDGDWFRRLQQVRPDSVQRVGKESLGLSSANSFCQTMGWELTL